MDGNEQACPGTGAVVTMLSADHAHHSSCSTDQSIALSSALLRGNLNSNKDASHYNDNDDHCRANETCQMFMRQAFKVHHCQQQTTPAN